MTDIELTDWAYKISERFEAINSEYIEMMGKHIKEIGELSATDIHRLGQMQKMGANVQKINEQLAIASVKTTAEINSMYDKLLEGVYKDSKELYNYRNLIQAALKDNLALQGFINSVKTLTAGTFFNIARTTNISDNYKSLVDDAILKVSSGVSDYKSEIRNHLKSASAGARVAYASGNTRRLDSAVRMNILEGVRQVNQGVRKEMGSQFGADGYEISVHMLCAPDHIDIQGKQYSIEDYTRLNESLKRPIGTLNCQHSIFPIILGLSEPVYSKEQLQDIKDSSAKKIEIDGKEYTKYECSQLMRKSETAMRYTKDEYIIAKASGDDVLIKQAEEKLRKQQALYRNISKESGLKTRYARAYVPGYRGNGINTNKIAIPEKKEYVAPVLSDKASMLDKRAKNDYNITYNPVYNKTNAISEDEIINLLAGGDTTKGSCASLGLAYCGQKSGWDVIDYRGGMSQTFFSRNSNLYRVFELPNINTLMETARSTVTAGKHLLKMVEEGKEYYFACGNHAAIVRKFEDRLQYLELQSGSRNGWKMFDSDDVGWTLRHRFGATQTGANYSARMFDVNDVKNSEDIKHLLGYLNTSVDKQVKGASGFAK